MRFKNLLPPLLTPLLALTTWALLFLSPLQIEWAAPDTRPLYLAALLAPLTFLAAGATLRLPALLLFGFLASLLPGFLLMPEIDRAIFYNPGPALLLAFAIGGFVIAAARWLNDAPPRRRPTDLQPWTPDHAAPPLLRDGADLTAEIRPRPPRYRDLWWPYQHHFTPRLLILPALLASPLYALNFAEGAPQAWLDSFGEQAAHAQVMADLLLLFLWIVVAYLFFISPGLNLELEQREMDQRLAAHTQALRSTAARTALVLLAAIAAIGAGVALLVLRLA